MTLGKFHILIVMLIICFDKPTKVLKSNPTRARRHVRLNRGLKNPPYHVSRNPVQCGTKLRVTVPEEIVAV